MVDERKGIFSRAAEFGYVEHEMLSAESNDSVLMSRTVYAIEIRGVRQTQGEGSCLAKLLEMLSDAMVLLEAIWKIDVIAWTCASDWQAHPVGHAHEHPRRKRFVIRHHDQSEARRTAEIRMVYPRIKFKFDLASFWKLFWQLEPAFELFHDWHGSRFRSFGKKLKDSLSVCI